MRITDKKAIETHCDKAAEVSDGLIVLAKQCAFALDVSCYDTYAESDNLLFVVDEYARKSDEDDAEIYNISDLSAFDYDAYERVSQTYYTTREEVAQHIAAFTLEKNHF